MTLTVGFGGVSSHACAALSGADAVLGVCEQERITRVRGAGVAASGWPDQALDAILDQVGGTLSDIVRAGCAEDARCGSSSARVSTCQPRHLVGGLPVFLHRQRERGGTARSRSEAVKQTEVQWNEDFLVQPWEGAKLQMPSYQRFVE